jgi:hypothetical protein
MIPRYARNGYDFLTVPSKKSVLNGISMDSAVSRKSLLGLFSIVFAGMAAE